MLQLEKSPHSNEDPARSKKKKESDLEKDQGTGEAREKGQDLPRQRYREGGVHRSVRRVSCWGHSWRERLFLFHVSVSVCVQSANILVNSEHSLLGFLP